MIEKHVLSTILSETNYFLYFLKFLSVSTKEVIIKILVNTVNFYLPLSNIFSFNKEYRKPAILTP